MFEGYKGAARRLDASDPAKIGALIGVGEDEIRAFMDVEAGGSGFDKQGRVKMLFEPHIFFKELGEGRKRAAAVKAGLAYQKWGAKPYPADSYPRLVAALAIDETAALRSASWGLGQLMGFNHSAAGYRTPQAMVSDFAADEENQLAAMVKFLKAKKLVAALAAHDWRKIESVYNGGGYGGAYATKLAAAYAKWQKRPDTPAETTGPTIAEVTAEPQPQPNGAGVNIVPVSAAPDDRLVIKRKPVLKSRKIWFGITSAFASGPAWISGMFNGMDWKTVAVMAATFVAMVLFFWFMYRHEIAAGMFGRSEPK